MSDPQFNEMVRDWIYACVEDSGTDVLGVMEMFDVEQPVADQVLTASYNWVRQFTLENEEFYV